MEAEIFVASPEEPFLSLVLEVKTSDLSDLLFEMTDGHSVAEPGTENQGLPGVRVSRMSEALGDALLRFLGTLEDPMDRRVLGPMCLRELLYRVLSDEQGDLLRSVALRDSGSQRVAGVIRYLESHFREPLDIPTIAREAGMSVSSLHHTFKEVTSLSPIQYLKQVRLHQARTLMLTEGLGASEAAHQVGTAARRSSAGSSSVFSAPRRSAKWSVSARRGPQRRSRCDGWAGVAPLRAEGEERAAEPRFPTGSAVLPL